MYTYIHIHTYEPLFLDVLGKNVRPNKNDPEFHLYHAFRGPPSLPGGLPDCFPPGPILGNSIDINTRIIFFWTSKEKMFVQRKNDSGRQHPYLAWKMKETPGFISIFIIFHQFSEPSEPVRGPPKASQIASRPGSAGTSIWR